MYTNAPSSLPPAHIVVFHAGGLLHRDGRDWNTGSTKSCLQHTENGGKPKKGDKQPILGLREELLTVARGEWLARVRQSQLHLEHWVMTPDEKHTLQQTLGWTYKDMVDAYAQQQAEMGPMYQRVDPTTLGTRDGGDKHLNSPSRFMHTIVPESVPAYANWAAELAKMSAASPHKPPKSIKSAELPNMPLYFVGALLQGTDLDAVAASDLEAFALHVSEEKIREYYAEACEASVHFQRILATVDPSQRHEVHADFERRMQELASVKEREWKTITVKELRKHQAAELQRRAAQQRAMRPPPRKLQPRREFGDWDYLDDFPSPHREHPSASTSQAARGQPVVEDPEEEEEEEGRRRKRPMQGEGYEHWGYDLSGYDPQPLPTIPFEMLDPYQEEEPQETGLRSVLTKWISNVGALLSGRNANHEMDSISSFDWIEPEANRSGKNSESGGRKMSKRLPRTGLRWEDPDQEESEEEFPMRKKSRWREKFSWSLGRKSTKRNTSPTSSDIGWADPDSY
ncbi:Sterol regulatory element binding protein cleavage-activating protein [Mycena venus]|uniref:Sterol regulatory element binding protein cleavage-activating protein n=1 Tax=Mycena venus TaxID=2733690 RepID=A0A8H6Y191_9AGAR|nr:Sterol regulatory element binding protein cleavage-activating protein [Mycena venus]